MDEFGASDSRKTAPSVKLIVGVVMGGLAAVGLVAVVVGLVVHSRRRKKNYETVPLLTEE